MSRQKWPPRPEPVPRQRPGQPAGCTMPRLLARPARALPRPAFLSLPFLRLALYTPSFPCSPPLFILPPLFSVILPSFFYPNPFSFFLPSFLPPFLSMGLAPGFNLVVSGCLGLCPLMSPWSQSGPRPSDGYTALLSIASSHPRARQGPQPPGLGEVLMALGIWRKPRQGNRNLLSFPRNGEGEFLIDS